MTNITLPIITFLLCTMVLASCQKAEDEDVNKLDKKILVEGYIFANETVRIKIASIDSRGSSSSHPAKDANVVINQGSLEIQLIEHDTIPGLYIQVNQNIILADTGKLFLNIEYQGKTHKSQTSFPTKLTDLEISNSNIYIGVANQDNVVTTLSWNEVPNAIGYCLFLRHNYSPAAALTSGNISSLSPFSQINYATSVDLKGSDFTVSGTYEIYVTDIRPEYQIMYSGYNNGNLMAAPSNINDGWGVFTAFNGQSVAVTIQ